MPALNTKTTSSLAQVLKQRKRELLDTIAEELSRAEDQQFVDIAGKVRDLGDEALADLLVDLDHAVVQHHLAGLREVEMAIGQVDAGHYGTCMNCGESIGVERLTAYPAATRCIKCQTETERLSAGHARL